MVKKLFSVLLLASVLGSASVANASAKPAAKPEVVVATATPEVKAAAEAKPAITEAKPSVVKRAVNAAKSTANSAVEGVKSAANSAVSGVKSAATRTVAASSVVVASVYNLAWKNHKGLTCATLAALTGVLLYNYNETFRTQVRGFFGLDDEACRFCPKACADECSSK